MKKNFLKLLSLLVLISAFVGCGSKSEEKNEGPVVKVIKVGYENNPGEPIDLAVKKWAEIVEVKSNGALKMELYPSSQLGSKQDLIQMMELGGNVVTITDGSALLDYAPELAILTAPFIADSYDEMDRLVESNWFKDNEKVLNTKGLEVLTANWHYGEMHMISKKPIRTPEDLRGIKMRCPSNSFFLEATKATGATPTPMPLSDLYTALAQGVVDAAFNPITVLYGTKMHEQTKYLSLTGHIKIQSIWLGSKTFFDTLEADEIEIIKNAGNEAGLFLNENLAMSEKESLQKISESGVVILEVDKNLFREKVKPFYESIPQWPEGLYEKVRSEMSN